jgi:hypothetical protein
MLFTTVVDLRWAAARDVCEVEQRDFQSGARVSWLRPAHLPWAICVTSAVSIGVQRERVLDFQGEEIECVYMTAAGLWRGEAHRRGWGWQ